MRTTDKITNVQRKRKEVSNFLPSTYFLRCQMFAKRAVLPLWVNRLRYFLNTHTSDWNPFETTTTTNFLFSNPSSFQVRLPWSNLHWLSIENFPSMTSKALVDPKVIGHMHVPSAQTKYKRPSQSAKQLTAVKPLSRLHRLKTFGKKCDRRWLTFEY